MYSVARHFRPQASGLIGQGRSRIKEIRLLALCKLLKRCIPYKYVRIIVCFVALRLGCRYRQDRMDIYDRTRLVLTKLGNKLSVLVLKVLLRPVSELVESDLDIYLGKRIIRHRVEYRYLSVLGLNDFGCIVFVKSKSGRAVICCGKTRPESESLES